MPTSEFRISSQNVQHARRYEATPFDILEDMLLDIHADFREFVFVDLGSGKGRVSLLAAQHPFKSVVGVEFVPKLVRRARENLASLQSRSKLSCQVHFVQRDAVEYEFPLMPLVLYLFNPFSDVVLRQVLSNLSDSLKQKPRPIFIMYYMPEFSGAFVDFPEFRKIATSRDWVIFEREESLT